MSFLAPLPHQSHRIYDALDEILALSNRHTSLAVIAGDGSQQFRANLLRFDPEGLHFVWPTSYGAVAVRDENEQECMIWSEMIRLQWHRQLAIGVAGPDAGHGPDRFRAAYLAMGKARSLGGGLTVGASALIRLGAAA